MHAKAENGEWAEVGMDYNRCQKIGSASEPKAVNRECTEGGPIPAQARIGVAKPFALHVANNSGIKPGALTTTS